jgi:hypothetical protein
MLPLYELNPAVAGLAAAVTPTLRGGGLEGGRPRLRCWVGDGAADSGPRQRANAGSVALGDMGLAAPVAA